MGKTFSYGNGKRLDDGKALAELGFQVNIKSPMTAAFIVDSFPNLLLTYIPHMQIGDYLDVAIL